MYLSWNLVLFYKEFFKEPKEIPNKGLKCPGYFSKNIYEHIYWGDGPFHTLLNVCPELKSRTVIINGVSKAYAMTGWRLGYAILPSVEEHAVFKNLNINSISCTPPFVQEAGREASAPRPPEPLAEAPGWAEARRPASAAAIRAAKPPPWVRSRGWTS